MNALTRNVLEFELPPELLAQEPAEKRARSRADVRMMVSQIADDSITHTCFPRITDFLRRGDVLVVNTSATFNAALTGLRETAGGVTEDVALHLSTPLSDDRWTVELRRWLANGSAPVLDAIPGDRVHLRGHGQATLLEPYRGSARLWIARIEVPGTVLGYAAQYGAPIRYGYVKRVWPLRYYQTVFAREPGSAEMPSAARAFTIPLVRQLEQKGVQIAPVVLHAGVSSLDADEEPYPERYRVPRETAAAIRRARAIGGRVIAAGTTAVRAIESVATIDGHVEAGFGWTDLVITPERGLHVVDGLLTGLHAPKASHLRMLEALAGPEHIERAYREALTERYLWHEFGDVHFITRGPLLHS